MFSSTTIASSTTKPVAMVSAINDRMSKTVSEKVHGAEGAKNGDGHRDTRDHRRADVAQKKINDERNQHDGDHQGQFGIMQRSADRGAADQWRRSCSYRLASHASKCGNSAFTLSMVSMMLAPG